MSGAVRVDGRGCEGEWQLGSRANPPLITVRDAFIAILVATTNTQQKQIRAKRTYSSNGQILPEAMDATKDPLARHGPR